MRGGESIKLTELSINFSVTSLRLGCVGMWLLEEREVLAKVEWAPVGLTKYRKIKNSATLMNHLAGRLLPLYDVAL